VPAAHAARYWDAARSGRTSIAISGGERADGGVEIMDAQGAVYLQETFRPASCRQLTRAAPSADPGFFPRRQAAQMFQIS